MRPDQILRTSCLGIHPGWCWPGPSFPRPTALQVRGRVQAWPPHSCSTSWAGTKGKTPSIKAGPWEAGQSLLRSLPAPSLKATSCTVSKLALSPGDWPPWSSRVLCRIRFIYPVSNLLPSATDSWHQLPFPPACCGLQNCLHLVHAIADLGARQIIHSLLQGQPFPRPLLSTFTSRWFFEPPMLSEQRRFLLGLQSAFTTKIAVKSLGNFYLQIKHVLFFRRL